MRTIVMLVAGVLLAAVGVVSAGPAVAAWPSGRPVCVRAGAPCVSWWHPHGRVGWQR